MYPLKAIMYKIIYSFNKKKSLKELGCSCKCKCGNILTINSSLKEVKEDIYEYTCPRCNSVSTFHFGMAPVPIKL